MKRPWTLMMLGILCLMFGAHESVGIELSGFASVEGRFFFNPSLFPEQKRHNLSVAIESELYHEWKSGSSATAVLFGRLDSADPSRSHLDIRELNYLWLADSWELRIGIGKLFWGVWTNCRVYLTWETSPSSRGA